MRTIAILLLCGALASCTSVSDVASPAELGNDVDEAAIRATVFAVCNVVSGPAGRRDWKRFEALFAPGGQLIVSELGKAGLPTSSLMTIQEFVARATPAFNEKGWFEWPVATRITHFGNIAQAWCTYEGREASNEKLPKVRGIDSFELIRIGNEWKVQSLMWQEESPAHPIPAEFLPKQ